MAVKIRLQRRGRKKRPFYHIVVADERAPRDGRFIEKIGTYNPMTKPATIDLDRDKAFDWLMKGAQPTDTARAILRFKGVMYKKHLQRGVAKGAITQDQADEMYAQWITDKENKIRDRVNETAKEVAEFYSALSGIPAAIVAEEPEEEVTASGDAEGAEEAVAADAAEEAAPEAEATEEATADEAAPAEEVKTEEPAAEAEEAAPEAEATEEAPAAEEVSEETKEVADEEE